MINNRSWKISTDRRGMGRNTGKWSFFRRIFDDICGRLGSARAPRPLVAPPVVGVPVVRHLHTLPDVRPTLPAAPATVVCHIEFEGVAIQLMIQIDLAGQIFEFCVSAA